MSQELNAFLANYYGTAAQPSAEEVAHAQQIDFFAKTAAANGIDLEKLSQDQINWLWGQVFSKEAEFPPPKDEKKGDESDEDKKKKDDEKKEKEAAATKEAEARKAAEAEFLQKKEAMAKIAEADFLGRVIAHSMWNESDKIAAARQAEAEKQAAAQKTAADDKDGDKGDKKGDNGDKGEGGSLRDRLMAAAQKKEDKGEEKKSSVSELDLKAAELAVQKIAASQYWDVNEAVDRLNAVLTLGAKESVKVASAPNVEAALDVRSLELLEMAGYPIKWEG